VAVAFCGGYFRVADISHKSLATVAEYSSRSKTSRGTTYRAINLIFNNNKVSGQTRMALPIFKSG